MRKAILPYALMLCMIPSYANNNIFRVGDLTENDRQKLCSYFVQKKPGHIYSFKSNDISVSARVEELREDETYLVFSANIGKGIEIWDRFTRMKERGPFLPNGYIDWSDKIHIGGKEKPMEKARKTSLDNILKKMYRDGAISLN